MRKNALLIATVALVAIACEEPTDPDGPVLEAAYLLDRVNGTAPPAPICGQGSADQILVFESVALATDDTYGRLQQIRIDSGPILQQEERGDFTRTDSTIVLVNAAEDTLTLVLLDSIGSQVRRVHPCGDTLRYAFAEVRQD